MPGIEPRSAMGKGKPHHGYLVHHLNLSCGKHIVPGAKAVSVCLSVCSRISSCFGPALFSQCFFMLPAGLQEAPPPSRSAPLTPPHGAQLLSRVLPPHPAPFGIQESQYVGGRRGDGTGSSTAGSSLPFSDGVQVPKIRCLWALIPHSLPCRST